MSEASARWQKNLRNPILFAVFGLVGCASASGLLLAGAGWNAFALVLAPGMALALILAVLTFKPARPDLDRVGLRVASLVFWGLVALAVGIFFRTR